MVDRDWTDGTETSWEISPWELLPGVRSGEELSRGERAADIVRNKMGSWGFVFTFTTFMFVWATVNVVVLANRGWDPYPFILLNLMLSALAGLQGSILLIAAKRADAVAAEQALSHLTISKASSELIKEVKSEMTIIKRLASEIHQNIKETK
jgi:uncharacterized membrane protein